MSRQAKPRRRRQRTVADRVYQKRGRYYLDVRDLGGRLEALVVDGDVAATTDLQEALVLAEARVEALTQASQESRRETLRAARLGLDPACDLLPMSAVHMQRLRNEGANPHWIATADVMLARAVHFFEDVQPGIDLEGWQARGIPARPRNLQTISVPDVLAFVDWLRTRYDHPDHPRHRKSALGPQSIRHHLSVLSGLYETAALRQLDVGNPVTIARRQAPRIQRSRTKHLEADEIAKLLEAARHFKPRRAGRSEPVDCIYPLVAFLCYTSARMGEARRVQVSDVDFDAGEIFIRGAVKGRRSRSVVDESRDRVVPLSPQLRGVLEEHVRRLDSDRGPLFRTADGRPIGDWRRALDRVAIAAGFKGRREIRTRRLRVSYATHRIACEGVTIYDVRDEMGHADLSMIARIYGRSRRAKVRFGPHLDYSIPFLAQFFPELAGWSPAPADSIGLRLATRASRVDATIAEFLAQRGDRTVRAFAFAAGIDDAVLTKLANGTQRSVSNRNLEKMRTYLSALRASA